MRVVDADAHINEDETTWATLDVQHPGWHGAGRSGGRTVHAVEGKLYPKQEGPGCGVPIDSALLPGVSGTSHDLDRRMADLDAEGIDVQVLFGGLAIAATTFDDAGFARDFARAYNGWLLREICARDDGRLRGVAVVPLQDVDGAVEELARIVRDGAVAVAIPPVVGDRNLDHPGLVPFFEAAESLDVAVAVHSAPGMNIPLPAADRFDNYAQVHCLSFPVDQMVALTSLAMGGVLDRFPALRVVFLECGIGWVPYYMHRMAEHREKRGGLLPAMTSRPEEHIRRGQVYFSFESEESLLPTYIERFGHTSLVYASDYPHWDAEWPGSVEEVRTTAKVFGDDVVADLLSGNARRLYRLDG